MAQIDYTKRVAIPAAGSMNSGLSVVSDAYMRKLLGKPGQLTKECSPLTSATLKEMLVTETLPGGMRVTGLRPAVESLTRIFARVVKAEPRLAKECKTAGMLCCRARRGSTKLFSNHSWGLAIDLYFGTDAVPMGVAKTHLGILRLYPYFHAEGWYWLAESSSPDAMHFEVARETIDRWKREGRL